MKKFKLGVKTKYEDLPDELKKLVPSGTDLNELDLYNQIDHVRFRVMHEIDIAEEEGIEETGITERELVNARRFMKLTGGLLK